MTRLLTASQMKRCDSYTIDTVGVPSRELMGRAAAAAAEVIMSGGFDLTQVFCICGTGNNGGDGLAVAKLLHDRGIRTKYLLCGEESRMTDECRYRLNELRAAGVPEESTPDMTGITLVVDAILGIGINGNVRGSAAEAIKAIAESGVTTVALDIPSGVNSDTGAVMGCAVTADTTVAFARLKPGHVLYPGRAFAGRTVVADIGIGESAVADDCLKIYTADAADVAEMLPDRSPHSHKGTYGRVLCAAGSVGMCGAAYFSALASYRSGAGIVEVLTPRENLAVMQTRLPEAIVTPWDDEPAKLLRKRAASATAVVIGPGLGQGNAAVRLVEEAIGCSLPLVIDADGLNILAANDDLLLRLKQRQSPTVLTPHIGEMSRLTGKSIAEIAADPVGCATAFSEEYGIVCVQKDSATVIADGSTAYVNTTGCSGLAKGGSGDVLSGVIGAFLAAGQSAAEAATAGVYIHGMAGQIAADVLSEYSLLATDIADSIGAAIKKILEA